MAEASAHILLIDEDPERRGRAKKALANDGIDADTAFWSDLSSKSDISSYTYVILNDAEHPSQVYEHAASLSELLPEAEIIVLNLEGCPEVMASAIRRITAIA